MSVVLIYKCKKKEEEEEDVKSMMHITILKSSGLILTEDYNNTFIFKCAFFLFFHFLFMVCRYCNIFHKQTLHRYIFERREPFELACLTQAQCSVIIVGSYYAQCKGMKKYMPHGASSSNNVKLTLPFSFISNVLSCHT